MQNAHVRRLEVGNEYLKPQTFQFETQEHNRGVGSQLSALSSSEAMPRH